MPLSYKTPTRYILCDVILKFMLLDFSNKGICYNDYISYLRFSDEQCGGDNRESPTKEALVSAINIFLISVF